ncbi:transposase, partial [Bacteroides eggerthii]
MEPSVKDKYIILGFVGFAILLISSIAALIVAEKFNQDNFVRLIVFVCGNLLGWLLYFSFQTVIFDTYEIYKIKFGKKKTLAETIKGREELPQSTLEPTAALKPMPTNGEAPAGTEPPIKLSIAPELHEKNRADYEDREKQEKEERIRMVMEYIHFYMPRIADEETVNHICKEVNSWMNLHTYKPEPITRRLTKEITNIPLRHFVWNISERFMYKKYYNGDNRARFI